MSVSETIQILAKAISATKGTLSPRHRLLLELLQLMPLYCEIKDLAAWEAAFQGAVSNEVDDSETGRLLNEVFEFGRFNMYTRFNRRGTRDCYANLSKLFQQAGIDYPKVDDFTKF